MPDFFCFYKIRTSRHEESMCTVKSPSSPLFKNSVCSFHKVYFALHHLLSFFNNNVSEQENAVMPGSICGKNCLIEDAEAAMKKLHFYRCSEGPNKWIFQEVSQPPEVGSVSYR